MEPAVVVTPTDVAVAFVAHADMTHFRGSDEDPCVNAFRYARQAVALHTSVLAEIIRRLDLDVVTAAIAMRHAGIWLTDACAAMVATHPATPFAVLDTCRAAWPELDERTWQDLLDTVVRGPRSFGTFTDADAPAWHDVDTVVSAFSPEPHITPEARPVFSYAAVAATDHANVLTEIVALNIGACTMPEHRAAATAMWRAGVTVSDAVAALIGATSDLDDVVDACRDGWPDDALWPTVVDVVARLRVADRARGVPQPNSTPLSAAIDQVTYVVRATAEPAACVEPTLPSL